MIRRAIASLAALGVSRGERGYLVIPDSGCTTPITPP
jgi:hypothetical protein